jgi:hypothetical protein
MSWPMRVWEWVCGCLNLLIPPERHSLVTVVAAVTVAFAAIMGLAIQTLSSLSSSWSTIKAARIQGNATLAASIYSATAMAKASADRFEDLGTEGRGEGRLVGVPRALPAGASAAGGDALAQACATVPASVEEGETWTIDIEGDRLGGRDIPEGQTEYFIYSTQCDAVWTTRFDP